jgi:hypothetical protein
LCARWPSLLLKKFRAVFRVLPDAIWPPDHCRAGLCTENAAGFAVIDHECGEGDGETYCSR